MTQEQERTGRQGAAVLHKEVRTQARLSNTGQPQYNATCRVWTLLTYNNLIFLYKPRLVEKGALTGLAWLDRHRLSRPAREQAPLHTVPVINSNPKTGRQSPLPVENRARNADA